MASFTKNKNTGNWDVIGPVAEIEEGCFCKVTKADGSTTTVTIGKVSKAFIAKFGPHKGKECVIGTVKEEKSSASYGGKAPGGRKCPECGSRDCAKAWNHNDLCDED